LCWAFPLTHTGRIGPAHCIWLALLCCRLFLCLLLTRSLLRSLGLCCSLRLPSLLFRRCSGCPAIVLD
jgi:hypothetical protein